MALFKLGNERAVESEGWRKFVAHQLRGRTVCALSDWQACLPRSNSAECSRCYARFHAYLLREVGLIGKPSGVTA